MLIREATAEDRVALARLCAELGYAADAAAIALRLRDLGEQAVGVVLVAIDEDGAVCGFAHAEPRRLLIADPFVELAGLVVANSAREHGTGKALLRAVEAWARAHGFASVHVHSNVIRERAHRFYRREGYAEWKRQAVFTRPL